MSKRRRSPNYYERRDAEARRDAARRAAARSPDAIAAKLLQHIDVDSIAHDMTRAFEGDETGTDRA